MCVGATESKQTSVCVSVCVCVAQHTTTIEDNTSGLDTHTMVLIGK